MKKKIISLSVAAFMCVSFFVGCGSNGTKNGNDDVELIEVESMLPEKVAETGEYVVQNGVSEYSIVLPVGADQLLQSVANDMQMFIKSSTGATLPIEYDGAYTFDEAAKCIALGPTTIWEGCGLKITDDLRETGYVMKRFGNTIVCNADNNVGTVSAAYDMLNYFIGFECYASDEVYYEKKDSIPLLDFNIKFIPTVDIRDIMSMALSENIVYNQRLRLFTEYGQGMWVTFAHTTISNFLPTSTYQAEHPDWYNASGTQVCYANEEMRAEMVAQIKDRLNGNTDGMYVMIGHEDNHDMCECTDCIEARERLGGYGGQELDFTNKIAEEVSPWVEENYPGRDVKYVFFAYQTSAQPPVKWDETQNKYVPLNEDFSVHKNAMVLYCPIEADFTEKFNSSANNALYQQLKGWYDIFSSVGANENICIWTYSITSKAYMAPTNNYAYFGEHYKTMADVGVSFIMDQFVHDSRVTCFEELRIYTQAKMMYRHDFSYNQLVIDFMDNYYKEASKGMTKYYEFYRAYLQYMQDVKAFGGALTVESNNAEYWPLEICQQLITMIDDAVKMLEPLKTSDPEKYQLLYDRVMKEKVTPIYLLFTHYMNSLTQAQKEQYWYEINDSTKKFNLNNSAEGRIEIVNKVETWRVQIFG